MDYDDCHAVTVSAAYLDNLLNATQYRTDNENEDGTANVNNFKDLYKGNSLKELKPLAVNALQVIISENSELNELWTDNEELYPKWKGNLQKLIERLS